MKLVSIDLEMSGLKASQCEILEFGAVIFDTEDNTPVYDLPSYRKVIKHEMICGQPEALKMNAWLIDIIAEGTSPELIARGNLLRDFRKWLKENGMPDENIPVAGRFFNEFDKQFIKQLPFYFDRLFKNTVIDPAQLYWEPGEDKFPSLQECMRRAGWSGVVPHNALADARIVVDLIRQRRDKIQVGY